MKFYKHTDDNFTTIRNDILQDENLSWKAKGIFVYLWSQKDDWQYYSKEVAKHSSDGLKSLRSGLKELQNAGYLKISQLREKGEFKNQRWDLSPVPVLFSPDNPKGNAVEGSAVNGHLTSTNSNKYLSKEPSSHKSKTYDEDSPYLILAKFLNKKIHENNPKAKQPNLQKWADDMRKIVELDKRDKHDVSLVIAWCQKDDFWSTNILSPSKLRKQFDRLYMKMQKEATKPNSSEQPLTGEAKQAAEEAKAIAEGLAQKKENSAKERNGTNER